MAISMLGALLPHYYANPVWHYSLYLGSIVLNVFVFYLLVKTIFKSRLVAILSAAFCLAFLQNNWQHSLLTSYRFIAPAAFSFLLCSFLFFFHWQRSEQRRFAVLSGLTFLAALMTYESFVLYGLIFLGVALYKVSSASGKTIWERCLVTIRLLTPMVAVLVLYLTCYVLFRYYYPTQYLGSRITTVSLSRTLAVIWQYTVSTIPGYFYFRDIISVEATFSGFGHHTPSLRELVELCRVEWAAKAVVLAALSAAIFLERRKIFTAKSFFLTITGGLTCVVAPVFLVGLTVKYQMWVLEAQSLAYSGPSYHAYFATIFLLVALLLFVNQKLRHWKIVSAAYIFLACAGIAIASLATDFYNYYITVDQQLSHLKWRTVDRFILTEEFKSLPENTVIYAPSLWRTRGIVANNPNYWTRYFSQKSGRAVQVFDSREEALLQVNQSPGSLLCFLALEQEPKEPNQYVVFARLDTPASLLQSSVYANKFTLFTYSKNRIFNLIGDFGPSNGLVEIAVNNRLLKDEVIGNMFVCKIDQQSAPDDFPGTTVQSTAPIDISRVIVSYFPIPPVKKGVQINYGSGFHGFETNAALKATWNWTIGDAELSLFSYFGTPVRRTVHFGLSSATERRVSVEIGETRRTFKLDGSSSLQMVPLEVTLMPGANLLRFKTDQPPRLPGNGDIRPIAFGVHNLAVEEAP